MPSTGLASAWQTIMLVVMALLGAAVLAGLILIQGEANRQRDRAFALQGHSYEVMILARALSSTIAQAEASFGRYVISGDKQLGQLYYDQWQLAGSQIERLHQITDDNSEQQPRIGQLRRAYDERGRELSLIALSTAYKKNGQALARFYQGRRVASLTTMDATLEQIIARERVLLDQRTAVAMHTVDLSGKIAQFLAGFGILLVLGAIALGWLTVQAQAERAVARADADEQRERAAELAAAVAHATAELREQEGKLRQAQKMDAIGQLSGGIAHDFNNMLAVVIGGLELARRHVGHDGATALHHIDSAAEGADRAAALTRRLLAFSREESLEPEPIDAAALVAGMSDLLDRTLGDAVAVAVSAAGEDWSIFADKLQLENAILNLAVNARDAMNGRGTLGIATGTAVLDVEQIGRCRAGEHVTVTVTDTGCGMTADVLERVFEPFFTTKPVGKGTGLGLSQIFALVGKLGGEIGIDSEVGQGTAVTLYIPRHAAGLAATPHAVDPVTLPQPTMPAVLEVLVVEDDPRVLAATVGAVEELGHRATACNDPLAAEALLAVHLDMDLIISDVLMPDRTGPELVADLGLTHPHLAVLFVTGYAGEAGGASEFGGHHVLRKPFTLIGLERAIAQAMSVERPAPPHRLAAE